MLTRYTGTKNKQSNIPTTFSVDFVLFLISFQFCVQFEFIMGKKYNTKQSEIGDCQSSYKNTSPSTQS